MMPDHFFAVGRGLGTILLVTCSFSHPWAPDKGVKGGLELSIVGGGQASFTILPISVGWMGGE